MNRCFVFCHGFGFDKDYWDNLKPYFLDDEGIYLDLGYFGQTNEQMNEQTDLPLSPLMNNPKLFEGDLGEGRVRGSLPCVALAKQGVTRIGIGHSLGLSKLIEANIKFDYLIGLNSFVNFLGNESHLRDERSQDLASMLQRFKLSPKSTLRHFYKRCGVSVSQDKLNNINELALLADLNYLQQPIKLPTETPILILGSKDDGVVPPQLIHDNFSHSANVTLEMRDSGKHGLGILEPEWVAQTIKKYI